MRLSDYTIRARLLALAALAVAGMLLVGLQGLGSLSQARADFVDYVDNDVEALTLLAGVRAGVGNLRRYEKDLLINLADAKAVERYRGEWIDTFDKVSTSLVRIGRLDLPTEVKRMPGGLQQALQDYRGGFSAILDRLAKGEFPDTAAANKAMEPVKGSVRAVDKSLGDMTEKISQRSAEQVARVDANARDIRRHLTLVVVAAVLLLAAYTAVNIRSILAPLAQAAKAAERIAGHDLSEPLHPQGRDETALLMRGLQGMQDALAGVVAGVREGAGHVADASREVAVGSMDLSQRTEQAAANLEETASAMEQLTASVTHNAESAARASDLAAEATDVARRGGAVVDEVVRTMSEISTSSARIADIISVIDGIAFQTNILALNAAVEAARAGEQGRGFAVVAGEVRLLAGRSAEAAKEIKTLISHSGERVDVGVALVGQAGKTMQQVIEAIARVASIASEISHAAREQGSGIGQIGQAIANMDQMTQQNAALVEESAAAAASLQQQADALASTVSVFRLG
ncbi:methyl-accepting chemotaxis protein [Pelomonas cellulosilytica]|uniref:methyl-accepting chemotaxis protein n=1 Tax=Pelomonas cellulosilytica TaxID=2906762 RepID=UPI00272CD6B1|nr:methyl-accepting chemotaxis protein [Pelomonas sp. P8]